MDSNKPVSKVLLLESDTDCADALGRFCEDHNLVGVPVRRDALAGALRAHSDLGGVLLSEDFGGSLEASAAIAASLDAARPELPIIVRRASQPTLDGLPDALQRASRAAWAHSDPASLRAALDACVFTQDYPDALVRGITEMTAERLHHVFGDVDVSWEAPSIVRDRIIFGEVFSLIPLETAWCRGYLLMQAEEAPLLGLLPPRAGREAATDFREMNSVLGELTNLIWGAFRNRYLGDVQALAAVGTQVQVPLLINHRRRYLSFGSDNPQLCIKYRLARRGTGHEVTIDQRFVFSLGWSPEAFDETLQRAATASANPCAQDAGELELF
ncbi:chemotaxis protein CheX [Paraburkholderia sp.]|uniref:chemotaxis protein CheX n=1 Tax=Paraburkholderia sp. TaxID=1926495 RepID=UPI0025E23821|nr:chemotaxis protein CheX [Paraburkholderia sp.]